MPKKEVKKVRGVFERPKGSGIWWIRYADEFGNIHREKVGLRSRAVEVYRQRKTEIRHGKFEPEDIRRRTHSIAEILEDRRHNVKGLRSFQDEDHRVNFWIRELGEKPLRGIRPGDIETVRNRMKAEQYKTASINRYLATLRAAFYQAMRNGKAERSPFEQLKLDKENNKRIRWLSDEEEHRLFQVLPRQYHSLVKVALHTGLRKTEQLSLTWADVDFKAKIITVKQSKSGEPRLIPMNSILEETLRKIPKGSTILSFLRARSPAKDRTIYPRRGRGFLQRPESSIFIGMTFGTLLQAAL
jgi:integrase